MYASVVTTFRRSIPQVRHKVLGAQSDDSYADGYGQFERRNRVRQGNECLIDVLLKVLEQTEIVYCASIHLPCLSRDDSHPLMTLIARLFLAV